MTLPVFHSPVLLAQAIKGLNVRKNYKYIDATIGGGGYSLEILKKKGIVLGIDLDKQAIDYVKKKIGQTRSYKLKRDIYLTQGNFADLKKIAQKNGFLPVSGIIFDLGMSTYQIEHSGRGFTYQKDEPLDMRMDVRKRFAAEYIVNKFSATQLYEIFTKFSEELNSRAIAEAIVSARTLRGSISSTEQLKSVIAGGLDDGSNISYSRVFMDRVNARVFQALRIAVNDELANLKKGLVSSIKILSPKGRLVVLSYHSLEDRIVKLGLRRAEAEGDVNIITKKPIMSSSNEKRENPKSRSVRLRIAEKI